MCIYRGRSQISTDPVSRSVVRWVCRSEVVPLSAGPSVGLSVAPPVGGSVDGCCEACLSRSVDGSVPPSVGWLVRKRPITKKHQQCVCVCTHGEHFVQNTEGRSIVISQLNSNRMGHRHRPYVFVPARVKDGMTPTFLRSDLHVFHGAGQVARVATGAEGAVEIDM